MASNPRTYRKLPGKRKRFLTGIHRLWLGEDHLLQVHTRVGVENYRRFYFSDIQALIARKTIAGKIYNGLLAVITLLLGFPALKLSGGASIFFYCAAALFLAILAVNWLLGPTCQTHLKTAVQQEVLPSLHRLKSAQRVMNRLRPLIWAKQGTLSRAQIAQAPPPGRPMPPAPASRSSLPQVQGRSGAATAARGDVHVLVVALLSARALLGVCEFYLNHMLITVIDMGLFITLAIAAIVFLVRQYDPPCQGSMLAVAWTTVAYIALSAVSGYVLFMGMVFKHPGAMVNQWKQIEQIARLSPRDSTFLMGVQLFSVIFAAVLAIVILVTYNSVAAAPTNTTAKSGATPRPRTSGRV